MFSPVLTVPILPLVVAVLRLRPGLQQLAQHTIPVQDDPALCASLAREYQSKDTYVDSRVPRKPKTMLEFVLQLVQLTELLKVDLGMFKAFAIALCGTKALLVAMYLPFCNPDGYSARLYALQPFMVWEHHEFHRLFTSDFNTATTCTCWETQDRQIMMAASWRQSTAQ